MNRNLVIDLASRGITINDTTRNFVTLTQVTESLTNMYKEEWFFESDNIYTVYMMLLQIAKDNTKACCEFSYILHEAYKSELTMEGYPIIRSVVFVASQLIDLMIFTERNLLKAIIENIKLNA